MLIIRAFFQKMIVIWIHLHLKYDTSPHQFFHKQPTILHVYIIVCQAMHQQQFSRQIRGFGEQIACFVASIVHLQPPHKTLCIARIIQPHIRNWCNCDATFERVIFFAQRPQNHITTVTPAPNRHSVCIDKLVFCRDATYSRQ